MFCYFLSGRQPLYLHHTYSAIYNKIILNTHEYDIKTTCSKRIEP